MNERWDIVDEHGRPTGKVIDAGGAMLPGEYHRAVSVWLRSGRGEYLISQRAPQSDALPGIWETTSGSVISGESSLQAAARETKEELGIDIDLASASLFCSYPWPMSNGKGSVFYDVWLFPCSAKISQIRLQPGETSAAMWASPETLRAMIAHGEFVPYTYLEDLFQAK
ncbi:MAG: NUDIX domain-containing protein [Clostridia bacterium]|nr:NUDIX domain-containing protein [Clostridia bacterium]